MSVVAKTEMRSSAPGHTAEPLLGRPWLLTVLLASGVCVAYLIAVVVTWGDPAERGLYANLGMIPVGLAATLLAISASRIHADRRARWAWGLLGAGLACFWAGDFMFFVYRNVLGTSPFPSLADAGYIAYYPLAFAGLMCIRGRPATGLRRMATYLAFIVVFEAGAAAIASLFLIPTLQSSHEDLLAYALSAGYPVGDVLLLAGVAWIMIRRVQGLRWSVLLLCGGLVIGLVADVLYGYENLQGTFQSGGLSDAFYMISWVVFAWAGYREVSKQRGRQTGRRRTDRVDGH
jgi:hypothetical protein